MAISPTQEEAGRDYSLQPPPHTLRPFRFPSWSLMASKDAANVRRAYVAVAAHSRTPFPSAEDTSNDGTTSFERELPSTRTVLPAVEAESLSISAPGYDRTLSASLDHVQDIAPPCVYHTAVRRRKGQKDIYLCYKDPQSWFSHQGDAFSPHQLPFLFRHAISARGKDVPRKIRVMVCEGKKFDLDAEEGDVLIFPDMVQYKKLRASEIESFVDDVLVHERDWVLGRQEKIQGTYIFVQPLSTLLSGTMIGAKMTFKGLDGATLPEIFKSEVASRGLDGNHVVKSSIQIYGHKHYGNVVIYKPDVNDLRTESFWSSLVCDESDAVVSVNMFSGKAKTFEEVLLRHLEKLIKDHSSNKHWLLHSFSVVKSSYTLATSLSVMVLVGALVAFKVYKKADTSCDVKLKCPKT